jgi:hypothetical protein
MAIANRIQGLQLCCDASPEQIKQLNSNVATTLALRFLVPCDEKDREDAFEGLVALCSRARGDLCIFPTWSEQAQGKTWRECTREFIEDFVLVYFDRYKDQSAPQILAAALDGKFRYVGRRLWSRMRDEISRRTALKNQEPHRETCRCVYSQAAAGAAKENE